MSNLEMEGQGRRIIMGVTDPLLLGPFYYIQTKFSILFCTLLYLIPVKTTDVAKLLIWVIDMFC